MEMKMGRQDKITPDIVEWIVSDEKVVQKWKAFAFRLGLESYVPKIDENYSYKRKKFEKQKMKELFDVWRRASPITYTQSRLMDILSKEGLNDMHKWLQLMNTENSRRKSEISYMLDSQLGTPRSAISLSPQPANHLLMQNIPQNRSMPSSPYSWSFKQNGKSEHGILKKKPSSDIVAASSSFSSSSANSSSDYCNSFYPMSYLNGADSRESSPDSTSRPMSRISTGTDHSSQPTSTLSGKKTTKTLRFADDLEKVQSVNGEEKGKDVIDSWLNKKTKELDQELEVWIKSPRKGSDQSVEKYFDNLITMIEDAAEGL